jgi:hypothetical protein
VVYASAAILSGVGGAALLYASWRGRLQPKRLAVTGGWLLIAVSVGFWIRAVGAEFGIAIAAMQLSIVAWTLVMANRHIRRSIGRRQEPSGLDLPRFQSVVHHSGRFLLAVPLAAGSGTLLVLAAVALLPWSEVDRLALAVLLVPLIWGVLAYWACLERRLARPALGLLAGGALGALVLYI